MKLARAFVDVRLVFPDRLDHAAAGLEDVRELALGVRHALLHLLRPQAGGGGVARFLRIKALLSSEMV